MGHFGLRSIAVRSVRLLYPPVRTVRYNFLPHPALNGDEGCVGIRSERTQYIRALYGLPVTKWDLFLKTGQERTKPGSRLSSGFARHWSVLLELRPLGTLQGGIVDLSYMGGGHKFGVSSSSIRMSERGPRPCLYPRDHSRDF